MAATMASEMASTMDAQPQQYPAPIKLMKDLVTCHVHTYVSPKDMTPHYIDVLTANIFQPHDPRAHKLGIPLIWTQFENGLRDTKLAFASNPEEAAEASMILKQWETCKKATGFSKGWWEVVEVPCVEDDEVMMVRVPSPEPNANLVSNLPQKLNGNGATIASQQNESVVGTTASIKLKQLGGKDAILSNHQDQLVASASTSIKVKKLDDTDVKLMDVRKEPATNNPNWSQIHSNQIMENSISQQPNAISVPPAKPVWRLSHYTPPNNIPLTNGSSSRVPGYGMPTQMQHSTSHSPPTNTNIDAIARHSHYGSSYSAAGQANGSQAFNQPVPRSLESMGPQAIPGTRQPRSSSFQYDQGFASQMNMTTMGDSAQLPAAPRQAKKPRLK